MTEPLAGIVPRWEWRTFGDSFGFAESLLGAGEPERVQESDETYVLSREADASVKVRDGLMDVKQLEEVNGDGLEQWRPVLKNAFPLATADVATMLQALGVSEPETTRDAYTLEQLLVEVVEPNELLAAAAVHKRRTHYRFGGCMTEVSEISAGGGSARTIVVEGEDPGLVAAAVRDLGLADRKNTCLALGLKTMLGL
jgi:exopolyphosphatase/guanosine-5'-triphosphate,3'-diphosphate pyrophosphatase